jgi:hypothetical protein
MASQIANIHSSHIFVGVVVFNVIFKILSSHPSVPSWRSYNFSSWSTDAAKAGPMGFIRVGDELDEMCL